MCLKTINTKKNILGELDRYLFYYIAAGCTGKAGYFNKND